MPTSLGRRIATQLGKAPSTFGKRRAEPLWMFAPLLLSQSISPLAKHAVAFTLFRWNASRRMNLRACGQNKRPTANLKTPGATVHVFSVFVIRSTFGRTFTKIFNK